MFAQSVIENRQQYISLGDFTLENGQKIYDCKIGYRAYGKLNADRSNTIIFPTYFSGTTKDLESQMVPGVFVDTTKFYLLLIDALGDGYSSSPSNSAKQPGLSFPVFTIRDMVETQYKMLTKKMNIEHLVAVMGVSMGGFQAFQWAVSHPYFMDKVIPIVGSPQLTANDLLLWNGELHAMETDPAFMHGKYKGHPNIEAVTVMHSLAITTPEYVSTTVKRDSFATWFDNTLAAQRFDWNNRHRQLEAMISHDITLHAGGSLEAAAKMVKAKMMIFVGKNDHMVNPIPAKAFSGYLNAKLIESDSNCGHLSVSCDAMKLIPEISAFLAQ
ncbi:MAG: alpha/beta fold hydrolase [Panacibacter sp.]